MTSKKLMLLGEIGVGKTSLVNRFVHGRFRTDYMPTLNVEIYTHELPGTAKRPPLTLLIWDTDGNFGETIFDSIYLKNAAAALIVADAQRPATLDIMSGLARGWQTHQPGRPFALVLNKTDLIAPGDSLPAWPDTLADAPGVPRFETSAANGDNVVSAFQAAADAIIRRGL